jgi:hypothetical protein
MTSSEYAESLGKVFSNLQTLETWTRFAILRYSERSTPPVDLKAQTVGSVVPISALTNYATLSALLRQFNELQRRLGREQIEDDEIVSLRDALAHGRIVAEYDAPFPVRLVKFSRENASTGSVTVTYNDVLDESWFVDMLSLTKGAIAIAIATAQA